MKRSPLAATVCVLLIAPAAVADVQTRAGYVARMDPICSEAHKAGQRMSRRVNALVKQGEDRSAGRVYARYWRKIFKPTIRRMARIARPPEDAERMAKWFDLRWRQGRIGDSAARLLGRGAHKAALRRVGEIRRLDNVADKIARPVGFKSCDS